MNDTEDHDALETDDAEEASHEQQVGGMDELLAYLHETRGFDFSGYKRAGLARRLGKRVRTLELENFNDYVDYLQVHPDEFANLFNSILINATSFFRDPSAWEYVAREGVPRVVGSKRDSAAVRVWCAGCATGQEAYTIAMVLADAMGLDAFSRRVKIYARTSTTTRSIKRARRPTRRKRSHPSRQPLCTCTSNAAARATCSTRTCGAR